MTHIPAERCLSIIQLLAENADEMPLGMIAERLNLPKSGAHRLLATLVEQGWAKQDSQTGFYRLTMRLAILGQRFYVSSGIPEISQPVLDKLAAASREYVRLAVVDSDSLVWVAHAQGARGGLMYQPALESDDVPLHATASGKVWLATLPKDRAMQIVLNSTSFSSPDRYGPNVPRAISQVMDDLSATAKRGFGLVNSEAERGVSAVAASVRAGQDGPVVGTISIAGPSVRMTEQLMMELVPDLKASANQISEIWPMRPTAESEFDSLGAERARQDEDGRLNKARIYPELVSGDVRGSE